MRKNHVGDGKKIEMSAFSILIDHLEYLFFFLGVVDFVNGK